MVRNIWHRLAAAAFFPALALGPSAHAMDGKGTLTFTVENDVVSGQDRHYTSGLRVAYVTAPVTPTALERLFARPGDVVRRGFALSQQIYTPEDIFTETPDPDDHPYAGYLFGEASVLTQDGARWDLFTLEVGVVGPWALAEETQNGFHRAFNFLEAEGWGAQLDNEVTVNLAYDWKGRPVAEGRALGLDLELAPVAGVSLGTVEVNARGGGMVRVGPNLVPNFGPARIRPSLTGTGQFDRGGSWFVFAGVQGRVVAHDLFLDGSLFRDGPSVEKEPFVADVQAGLVAEIGAAQLSWTYVRRTRRFETQADGADEFGAFSVSFKL